MIKKLGRLGIVAVLVAVPLLTAGWLAIFYTEVGMAKEVGIHEPDLSKVEYEALPQAVIDDAVELAAEFFGDSKEKIQDFVDDLLASYIEARDTDVVVMFNSGGWGWNLTEETPGWASILDGIKTELKNLGYESVVLNYRRTSSGIRGCLTELMEAITRYPHKARELASRVEFLSVHLPDLRIIVAGESTGTVISDKTMGILKDNANVYSIQTGTPFWHKPTALERTLLMNSNGQGIDTFSYGNIPVMIWSTIRGWFGMSPPDENPGNILSWLKAPGHDYSWQYPGVCNEVVGFLEMHFGEKNS
jgi:hypothetical protein